MRAGTGQRVARRAWHGDSTPANLDTALNHRKKGLDVSLLIGADMASKPIHICTALRERPDLAREIGLLVGDYAALELILFNIFMILSRSGAHESFSLFFSQRSIKRKTELLEKEMSRMSPPLQVALKRLIRRMKTAAARRTEIAHVHTMKGGSGPMRLQLFGEKAKVAPLDDAFINRTLQQFHTLGIDLMRFASYVGALAPRDALAKINELYDPIDTQLQRTRNPRSSAPFEKDVKAASDRRLGLDPLGRFRIDP